MRKEQNREMSKMWLARKMLDRKCYEQLGTHPHPTDFCVVWQIPGHASVYLFALKNPKYGAGEIAHQLRALDAIPEGPGLFPSTHM